MAFCGKINCNSYYGWWGVNNAGVGEIRMYEDFVQFSYVASLMVIKPACMIAFCPTFVTSL